MTNQANNPIQSVEKTPKRLYFVDHIKVALTMLVIAHHASQAYTPLGGAWVISNPTKSAVLMPTAAVNAAFFMGLFFLISGFFVPDAYDRKGAGAFLKTRLLRLGLPAMLFAIFVFGPFTYFSIPEKPTLSEYIRLLYQGGWRDLYGHLWFLLHLLVYNVGYVLWRLVSKRFNARVLSDGKIPWHAVLLIFTIILILFSWVVRFRYTMNQWVPLLYLVPAEVAHLPQYISMFIVGILANRLKALDRLPTDVGMVWLGIGVVAAGWFYYDSLLGERFMVSQYINGKNTGSLIWSTWEALVCVGLGVGLLVVFREWLHKQPGRWMSALIRAQYGAFIFHLLVVIALQAALAGSTLPPFTKYVIVTIIGVVLSFRISHLVLKIPGVRKVI